VRFSTPAQDAAAAPGYQPSGESEFSRRAASGDRPVSMNGTPRNESKPHLHLLQHQLIAKNDHELSKIQKRLVRETDPVVRQKLQRNLEIKSRFLSRLYAQQMMRRKRHEREAS
jgi:hypothetical protein